jgi:hypothetical protein
VVAPDARGAVVQGQMMIPGRREGAPERQRDVMYTYQYHVKRQTWVVWWNGMELRRRFYLSEAAARAYCEVQNSQGR